MPLIRWPLLSTPFISTHEEFLYSNHAGILQRTRWKFCSEPEMVKTAFMRVCVRPPTRLMVPFWRLPCRSTVVATTRSMYLSVQHWQPRRRRRSLSWAPGQVSVPRSLSGTGVAGPTYPPQCLVYFLPAGLLLLEADFPAASFCCDQETRTVLKTQQRFYR